MQKFIVSLASVSVLAMMGELKAEQPNVSPYAKGGVVSIVETANYRRYVHTFTNTESVATFRNRTSQTLHTRCLVVGAGGAGGYGYNSISGGGGGGGGGGVWECGDIDMAPGARWSVLVGKGAAKTTDVKSFHSEMAGSSSISNANACIALVPGGGNGGETVDKVETSGHTATVGAAGGGGIRSYVNGAAGTYASSIFGASYGPFSGGDAIWGENRSGGGGGAGAAGNSGKGGEGLVSDITGVSLVYGSGGGGGGSLMNDKSSLPFGAGGTRAGDGAKGSFADSVANLVPATEPALNSGAGGGGGLGGDLTGKPNNVRFGTSGADGVVIIAYEIRKVPFEGGEVTKIAEVGNTSTYIHVFTNAREVATFVNRSGQDIAVRCLVVGAGGAGGFGFNTGSGGGGGGGGGGVLDVADVTMSAASTWTICVGKGATRTTNADVFHSETAGASSISNVDECVVLVPGGGNGGETKGDVATSGHAPTEGAAGGGGIRASTAGAAGTYASSVLGVSHGPFAGGSSVWGENRSGGGGGAGAAGDSGKGGEGLVSDITGASLVYGSGGGGGGSLMNDQSSFPFGAGGTRAGDGAKGSFADSVANLVPATEPALNSGAGGGGGLGGDLTGKPNNVRFGTSGADGVVVIRYEWIYNPNPAVPGMVITVR